MLYVPKSTGNMLYFAFIPCYYVKQGTAWGFAVQGCDDKMDEFERAVGQVMGKARERHGLSQLELAERLGIQEDLVCRIENGSRPLEVGEFFDWSAALGVDGVQTFEEICRNVPKSA